MIIDMSNVLRKLSSLSHESPDFPPFTSILCYLGIVYADVLPLDPRYLFLGSVRSYANYLRYALSQQLEGR